MGKDKKAKKKAAADKPSVVERLDRAHSQQLLVRVRRSIPGADAVEGFVVARSSIWLLLASLTNLITLDGWVAVRLQDIESVKTFPDPNSFEIKALQARGQWPPTSVEGIDLTNTVALLRTASVTCPMIAIHTEFDRTDVCWIGHVADLSDESLSLREVTPKATWLRKPRLFNFDDITHIDFGGGYEEALTLVAHSPMTY